ncbi:MAG: hypothetical protein K8L99_29305 [Anaerolineae bacterium]|nr:hypothetical protein [Anaerolineae bacterium]
MATLVQDSSSDNVNTNAPRRDIQALWAGVIFSLVFTAIIWALGGQLADVPHLPDAGAAWYYWKLPEPTLMSRLTSWGFYLAHQFAIFGLIWYAQKYVRKYKAGLHPVNVVALGVNALFIVLHLLQTHIWYDGLAQDTSIFSSQGAVIVMLIWIMLMENNRRGVIFGKKLPLSQRVIRFARKYHGYFFAWAIIYTFWFHPMEATSGHLVGFFYTFLLMLQGSLFFTRIHINKWWMFVQEIVVLAHGTLVAIVQGNNMWPMFFFGFAGVFIITQMHGLGLSRTVKWLFLAAYAIGALIVYSDRGVNRLWELASIPAIDYIALVVLAALIWLVMKGTDFVRNRLSASSTQAA